MEQVKFGFVTYELVRKLQHGEQLLTRKGKFYIARAFNGCNEVTPAEAKEAVTRARAAEEAAAVQAQAQLEKIRTAAELAALLKL